MLTTLLNCVTFSQTNGKLKWQSCSGAFVAYNVWAKVKISYEVEIIRSKLLVTSEKYPNVLGGVPLSKNCVTDLTLTKILYKSSNVRLRST